jgi:hypothetical protein
VLGIDEYDEYNGWNRAFEWVSMNACRMPFRVVTDCMELINALD